MFVVALTVAHAGEPPSPEALAGWREHVSEAVPEWAQTGTVWVRSGEACLPAAAVDVAHLFFDVALCREAIDAGELVCVARLGLADGWEFRGHRCDLTPDDGPKASVASSHANGPPEHPQLVAADGGAASWAWTTDLMAHVARERREKQPCTAASLKALGKEAKQAAGRIPMAQDEWLAERNVVDGHLLCDTSTGVRVESVVIGVGQQRVGVGTTVASTPVDCRQPCAENPARRTVAELQSWLDGRVFVADEAHPPRLFATSASCLGAGSLEVGLGTADVCASLGPSLTP